LQDEVRQKRGRHDDNNDEEEKTTINYREVREAVAGAVATH
jgi:hypothetical protein